MKPLQVLPLVLVGACRAAAAPAQPGDGQLWLEPGELVGGQYTLATASLVRVPRAVVAGGRIAFDDQRVAHVFSPVTGRVLRAIGEPGHDVKKGSPLAVISAPDVGTAWADAAKARADLAAASRELARQKLLVASQAAAGRDLETAQDNAAKAQAEEARAVQRLRMLSGSSLDAASQQLTLLSPIDGRVLSRATNPGLEVQGQLSGGSAPELFTIGSTDSVWVMVDVAEADLAAVAVGAEATVRVLAYPGQTFVGKVEWVSSTLDPATRTARVRCTLANPEHLLKPEMFASVSIARPPIEQLAVPRAAVVRIDRRAFVYVAAGTRPDGKRAFQRQRIEVGAGPAVPGHDAAVPGDLSGGEVPVLAGLSAGDEVLVSGQGIETIAGVTVDVPATVIDKGIVAVAPAEAKVVSNTLTLAGHLTFDDQRVTHVFSPVSGRVTRLIAAPGQHVARGAPLAIISSPDLGAAFSDELKAKADLVAADHELARQRELYAARATAGRDLDAAEDAFARAQAEYDRAAQKARLLHEGASSSVSQDYVLRSPIDGDVVARNATPGLDLQGQYGGGAAAELFTIGSLSDLWLLGDVYEVDLPRVAVGAEAALEVPAFPGRVFRGRVDWVSDTLDPATRTVKVRCVLDNAAGTLKPEMAGVMRIDAPTATVTTVPRDALLHLGDQTVVFVETTGSVDGSRRFERRDVTADEWLPGDVVAVLTGVRPGEHVAARGSIFLAGSASGT